MSIASIAIFPSHTVSSYYAIKDNGIIFGITGVAALKGMMMGGMSLMVAMMMLMHKKMGKGGPWQSGGGGPWQGGGGMTTVSSNFSFDAYVDQKPNANNFSVFEFTCVSLDVFLRDYRKQNRDDYKSNFISRIL